MAQVITKQQVQHVAKLANIPVTDEEIERYTGQLEAVLEHVKQLDEVDVTGVEPTYQTLDGTENVLREDKVNESLSQEEALSQAYRTYEGFFVTKNVFSRNGIETQKDGPSIQKDRPLIDPYNAILTNVDSKGTIGHKDLFLTKGAETTAGSLVLEGYKPQYSSSVVELLEHAGYKTKAKMNCDAWAHGSSGENSAFGPTKNPWNLLYSAGGSSSGSAAAVAAGLVEAATGTDTGGSIRLPASFCGVTALKPTYGAVSRYGIVAMASSLDSPGVFARSVKEVKKLFEIVAKPDDYDATSRSDKRSHSGAIPSPSRESDRIPRDEKETLRLRSRVTVNVKTIGLPKEYFGEGIDPEVKSVIMNAVDVLKKQGFRIVDVELPHTKYGISVYYLVQTTEVASNLARYDGIRYGHDRSSFGAEAKRRIMLGTYASSAGYSAKFFEKAARARTLVIQDFERAFRKADVLLGPVSPTPPFKLGEKVNDPLAMYLSDVLTVPINLAGLPGLALPCGFTKNKLPIGMQLIGKRWGEEILFTVGERFQKLTKWHEMKPEEVKSTSR